VRCAGYRAFDARLPGVEQSIPIGSLHDAMVFTRRWVIRDKDPALKTLLRRLERSGSADAARSALDALREALASRSLLPSRRSA
jgi:hypothetical protein